ncbi:Rad9-domain-containing protein [Pilobolus umbonatus]|nr:Rad9-domain-containing protein [Pilobolus umbonatus]
MAASLDAMAYIGDELVIDVRREQLILSTNNMALTAQAMIRFSPKFFHTYLTESDTNDSRVVQCRVLIKNLCSIFKKNQSTLESLSKCELSIDKGHLESAMNQNAKLYFKLVYQNGVTKKNTLWYSDANSATRLYPKEHTHHFVIEPTAMSDQLMYFHPSVVDVLLECGRDSVKMMSYWEESRFANDGQPYRTEFKMEASDFSEYNVSTLVRLIFNIKEFKAIIQYMEDMNCPLHANFDFAGKPIVFTMRKENDLMADFALMTHPDSESLSLDVTEHSMVASTHSGSFQRTNSRQSRTSVQSRQSMQRRTSAQSRESIQSRPSSQNIERMQSRSSSQSGETMQNQRGKIVPSRANAQNGDADTIPYISSNADTIGRSQVRPTDLVATGTEDEPLFFKRQSTLNSAANRREMVNKMQNKAAVKMNESPLIDVNKPSFEHNRIRNGSANRSEDNAYFPFDSLSNSRPEKRHDPEFDAASDETDDELDQIKKARFE